MLRDMFPPPLYNTTIYKTEHITCQMFGISYTISVYVGDVGRSPSKFYSMMKPTLADAVNDIREQRERELFLATGVCEYCGNVMDGEVCNNPECFCAQELAVAA